MTSNTYGNSPNTHKWLAPSVLNDDLLYKVISQELEVADQQNQIVIYETQDNTTAVEVLSDGNTVWLNRNQMAVLFGRDVKTIGKHVNNALREELAGFSVVAKFATTATDGKSYQTEHYNLDMMAKNG